MNGFHVKSVAEDKGNLFFPAKVSNPIPGEHTFNANDQVIQVGFNHLHECLGVGFDVLVDQDIPLLIQYADIEAAGMQIDSAVMFVCLGVEFH
jgi:hypothetical protein